jgi:acyl-coenzyme A synthetase/AMP-(fatty) acid ligase
MLYDPDGSGILRPAPHAELSWRDPRSDGTPRRLWIRHPSAALGYWQRAEATAECFAPGCFCPGDLFLDAGGGRFEIRGREDDLLKIAGQWVSVADVDHALIAGCREFVQELGTAPVQTGDGLGMIAVFAVAKDGLREQATSALGAAIEALPRHRRPRETYWVDALPRTPTGKLQRNKLIDLRTAMGEQVLVD